MQSKMALITFMEGGGGQVDNTLPSGGYPSHGLPPGAVQLPVFPFDPTIDNSLPGGGYPSGQPVPPGGPGVDNTLPGGGHVSGQPIVPGKRFIVKWFACMGLILVPDNTLPPTPEPK